MDPNGHVAFLAVVAVAWAVYEVGSQVYDTYNAVKTVADPNATRGEKIAAVTGAGVSLIAPGGGE